MFAEIRSCGKIDEELRLNFSSTQTDLRIIFLYDHCLLFEIIINLGGAHGVMVIVVGNGHATRVQILDKTDCISRSTNNLGKGMNPIILPPAMGK